MERLLELIARVAPTNATVLVSGETGTGKELVARALHELSRRAGAFVPVNCSALPETLLDAELFGHEKGAFTGAAQSRKGLVEEAAGGTLFLDEISTLSENVQIKLLRLIQERQVHRIGGRGPKPVDFRLVAATNVDLWSRVRQGRFRADLFYRLNVFPVRVPPLRERRADIALLAEHFSRRFARENGLAPPRLTAETLSRMTAYAWPGNVRELENFIERSVILYPGASVLLSGLPEDELVEDGGALVRRAADEDWSLDRLEREHILAVLDRVHWRQGIAAQRLGVSRRTVHRKLRRYREDGLLTGVEMGGAQNDS